MARVRWEEKALNELTALWLEGDPPARRRITAAAHAIDQDLKSNPLEQGESRDANLRVHFVQPLGVLFEVVPDGSLASVLHVWCYR